MQNLAPGAAERLGLGAATLRADHPELVVVNLTGYGLGGPFEQHKAYDMLVQAESGLIAITGTPETPVKTGIPTADIASGMYCSQAAVAALLRRWRTGEGATIEVSMLEATVEWMGYAMYTQLYTGAPAGADGPQPQLDRALRRLPDARRAAAHRRPERPRLAHARATCWRSRSSPTTRASPPTSSASATAPTCDAALAEQTARFSTEELSRAARRGGRPRGADQGRRRGRRSPAAAGARPLADDRDRARGEIPALLPPATFEDGEAPMGDVPALGQHTRALLTEFGADADDLIARGIASS